MTEYKRGDVIIVRFIFPDGAGVKQRPAIVVSADAYQRRRQETIVAAVTSRTDRILFGDYVISDWKEAGLLLPSVVTGIVRTIKRGMVSRKLGQLSRNDLNEVDERLTAALGLNKEGHKDQER